MSNTVRLGLVLGLAGLALYWMNKDKSTGSLADPVPINPPISEVSQVAGTEIGEIPTQIPINNRPRPALPGFQIFIPRHISYNDL